MVMNNDDDEALTGVVVVVAVMVVLLPAELAMLCLLHVLLAVLLAVLVVAAVLLVAHALLLVRLLLLVLVAAGHVLVVLCQHKHRGAHHRTGMSHPGSSNSSWAQETGSAMNNSPSFLVTMPSPLEPSTEVPSTTATAGQHDRRPKR
jgi:hypothetical protein